MKSHSDHKIPLSLSLLSAGDGFEISDDYEFIDIGEMITGGRPGTTRAYLVTGDSMLEHIRPGDIVFVDTMAEPRNGDTVVSCVNGQNNVKIFWRDGPDLYLVPRNGKHRPRQITAADSFHILGVVTYHLGKDRA